MLAIFAGKNGDDILFFLQIHEPSEIAVFFRG